MKNTLDVSDLLTVKQCPVCFINYAIPNEMEVRKRENGGNWHCPNGHSLVFRDTEAARLKKELDAAQSALSATKNQLTSEREQHEASRRESERLKSRVKNGVCPCCKRSFCNLQRHIKTKHPDFAAK